LKKNFCHPSPVEKRVFKHPIEILYEDDYYVVFDKPPGLLVIPTPKDEQTTLVNIVNQQCRPDPNTSRLHPCHRIDRETSGAIIFAKGKRCQKLMMDIFKQRAIMKKYIAFVHGALPESQGEFKKPIKDTRPKKFGGYQPGVPAVTRYSILKVHRQFSVVEVQPVTGRTNQIRIHFSEAGHPLVGDRKYAFARDFSLKFRRTALHAASLEWTHPVTKKNVLVRSNIPKDMAEFLVKH
jgi:tRNA pseudouridine32 synthase/23S rRNA pseudouridine746 synthase/23S rRNA pseudouridine1911/1915/1917 synthase